MTTRRRPDAAPDLDGKPADTGKKPAAPVRVGRLDTLKRIRVEATKVYGNMRRGEVESQVGRRLVGCLTDIGVMLERSDLEVGLKALEERLKHGQDH